jgi:acyl-CoA thioesterase-2
MTSQTFVDAMTLERIGPDTYTAPHAGKGHNVVFGGQLMGQSIMAALEGQEGMHAKTLHIVFARAAKPELPVEIEVERMHVGRTFGSATVTVRQGDRLCTRAIVLLTTDEGDLISHGEAMPAVGEPEAAPESAGSTDEWQIRYVGGVDINDPSLTGPAELDVWTRFGGAPDDPAIGRALLAFATDGFCIAAAMRPHEGVGQSLAHRTISTGVISHTITFHEPVSAADWMLLRNTSPYAGHGRVYGRGDVFSSDGRFVASFVQDSMVRPMSGPPGSL